MLPKLHWLYLLLTPEKLCIQGKVSTALLNKYSVCLCMHILNESFGCPHAYKYILGNPGIVTSRHFT